MTSTDIVISSSWKVWGLDAMQRMWVRRELPGKVIGITPNTASDKLLLSVDLDMDFPAVKYLKTPGRWSLSNPW